MAQWMKLASSAFLAGSVAMLLAQGGQRDGRPQFSAEDSWPRSMPQVYGTVPSTAQRTWDDQLDRGTSMVRTSAPTPSASVVSVRDLGHRIPRKAISEFEKATKAQQKGELSKSTEHLLKAISIDPEFYDAVNNLGANYLNTKQVQFAIEQFNAAIKIGPHRPMAYTNLSLGLLLDGKWQDAERAARQALTFDRVGTRPPFILGCTLVVQQKFTNEAEQSLRKASADFPEAILLLAPVLVAKGDVASARDHLQRYLASGDRRGVQMANVWMQQLDQLKK